MSARNPGEQAPGGASASQETPLRTKEQRRAERAFGRVAPLAKKPEKEQKEFRSFAESFPTLIHSCGLVQALAFASAKKREDYIKDLCCVMSESEDTDALYEQSRTAGLSEYLLLAREALAAASWLKRYAQALLKSGSNSKGVS
jgi:CRISPR-associated protein Cmr5